jgi:RNA methyltransferase, TrmH family
MEPLSKARIKLIQSLQHKKFRLKYDKFILEGLKINIELIREKKHMIEEIYYSNPDYQTILENIINPELLCPVTPQQMHMISQMTTPPGILSVCNLPQPDELSADISGMRIFYLDAIRDPGNMGTILRTADWFGLDFVILSPDCVDKFNHKVLQASMGSALRIKTCELSHEELLLRSGRDLMICDAGGKSIYSIEPPEQGIIVFGNESLGVSDDIMHQVKEVIAIPGDRSLGAESLNVASAAAIVASWWRR